MKNLDGKSLRDFRQWRCAKNKDHVLGVTERVKVNLQVDGRTLKYHTTRLLIFRNAVDLSADVPAEIEVGGMLDGKTLNMTWQCSIAGCGCISEWTPDKDFLGYIETYLAE